MIPAAQQQHHHHHHLPPSAPPPTAAAGRDCQQKAATAHPLVSCMPRLSLAQLSVGERETPDRVSVLWETANKHTVSLVPAGWLPQQWCTSGGCTQAAASVCMTHTWWRPAASTWPVRYAAVCSDSSNPPVEAAAAANCTIGSHDLGLLCDTSLYSCCCALLGHQQRAAAQQGPVSAAAALVCTA